MRITVDGKSKAVEARKAVVLAVLFQHNQVDDFQGYTKFLHDVRRRAGANLGSAVFERDFWRVGRAEKVVRKILEGLDAAGAAGICFSNIAVPVLSEYMHPLARACDEALKPGLAVEAMRALTRAIYERKTGRFAR